MTEQRYSREDDVFFHKELRALEKEVLETDYPEMVFANGSILPISTELPEGTKSFSYKIRNKLGMSKIIENPADDLPRVGIDYKEVIGKIHVMGNEFGFSFRDIRSAKLANAPLESDLMFSSKEASMLKFNEVIQFGDPSYDIVGLYNNPNITEYAVSTVGTGTPSTLWLENGVAVKTGDQIIADVNGIIRSVTITSKNTKRVNKVLLPLEHYTYIAATPRTTTSDATILGWLEANNPNVQFVGLNELEKERLTENGILGPDGVSALEGAMMVAMTVAKDTVKIHNPMPHKFHKAYQLGLEMITPTEMEFGGCDIRKPFAFAYGKNI